ncbi:hypothetical protein [Mycobacteroides salmoniphilum]|uniref:hypothetical protein n=1 Tax=Mycobacteroides salmoniphilum TaxID=404941 RepID=UPI0010C4979B|nr:hypothetical protein [Mycobacteroides salmoniphilum]QCH23415.1 hypothetical protein DSM43276_01674 [Mycobacteroides salmoniphilum]
MAGPRGVRGVRWWSDAEFVVLRDLRLSSSTALVEDMERVTRKNEGNFTAMDWMPLG